VIFPSAIRNNTRPCRAVPEARRMDAGEVLLLLFALAIGRSCHRDAVAAGGSGGASGADIAVVLVVDELVVVVCAHFAGCVDVGEVQRNSKQRWVKAETNTRQSR
jgi:hypothetical protein